MSVGVTVSFAEEELERTKTEALDPLGMTRFANQTRPVATRLPENLTGQRV